MNSSVPIICYVLLTSESGVKQSSKTGTAYIRNIDGLICQTCRRWLTVSGALVKSFLDGDSGDNSLKPLSSKAVAWSNPVISPSRSFN